MFRPLSDVERAAGHIATAQRPHRLCAQQNSGYACATRPCACARKPRGVGGRAEKSSKPGTKGVDDSSGPRGGVMGGGVRERGAGETLRRHGPWRKAEAALRD